MNSQNSNSQDPTSQDATNENVTRKFTRDEITAIIKDCAAKLGHVPTRADLIKVTTVKEKNINRHFGSYQNALRACGLEGHGCGYTDEHEETF